MSVPGQRGGPTATPKVFICYRREESAAHAGRLHDALIDRFGEDSVFMDVEMAPGIDYVKRIPEVVAGCHVLIVVMGPQWAKAEGPDGGPRIADPEDFVRLEVETGLGRPDVTAVPLLVSGAKMPRREDLPSQVRPLADRNALELSDGRWRYDVGRLVGALEDLLPEVAAPPNGDVADRQAPPAVPARGRLVLEGSLLAGASAYLGRLLSDSIEKGEAQTESVEFVAGIVAVRTITWAIVGLSLAIWLALRLRRVDPPRWAIRGLIVGAIGGAVGGLLWALPVELVPLDKDSDAEGWVELASLAVTGAFIGGMLGGQWSTPRPAVGVGAGLLAGALIQFLFVGLADDISQPLKYGLVAAAVAGLALAALALERASPATAVGSLE